MGIAGGGVRLAVAEQPADHRQALAEGERPGRERVAEVVDADVLQAGPRPDPQPVVVEVRQAPPPGLAPAITQGLPGTRGTAASTDPARGGRGTVRGPILLSRSLISPAAGTRS